MRSQVAAHRVPHRAVDVIGRHQAVARPERQRRQDRVHALVAFGTNATPSASAPRNAPTRLPGRGRQLRQAASRGTRRARAPSPFVKPLTIQDRPRGRSVRPVGQVGDARVQDQFERTSSQSSPHSGLPRAAVAGSRRSVRVDLAQPVVRRCRSDVRSRGRPCAGRSPEAAPVRRPRARSSAGKRDPVGQNPAYDIPALRQRDPLVEPEQTRLALGGASSSRTSTFSIVSFTQAGSPARASITRSSRTVIRAVRAPSIARTGRRDRASGPRPGAASAANAFGVRRLTDHEPVVHRHGELRRHAPTSPAASGTSIVYVPPIGTNDTSVRTRVAARARGRCRRRGSR